MTPIAELTKGNWFSLLPSLGIDAKYLKNKHGPCPMCGGVDRFRWDNKWDMGGYICTHCGAGNGFDLVMKATGKTFKQIAEEVTSILGPSTITKKDTTDTDKAIAAMRAIWNKSTFPSKSGPVDLYLTRRIGQPWKSASLRENLNLWCDNQSNIAMLWKVITHNNIAINIHKTYLTPDGHKSSMDRPKRVMQGVLPDGCAVRTAVPQPIMGVAEGIESALSASIMYNMPVWACINGSLLSKWIPPKICQEVHIFADNDSNYTGQSKAYILANRIEVQYKLKAIVHIPPTADIDYNDIHREALKADAALFKIVK